MKLLNETILAILIEEVKSITDISLDVLLSNYKNIWEKYADYSILKDLLELHKPCENWDVIQRAKRLALGEDEIQEKKSAHPLCSVFSNVSVDGVYPKKMYYKQGVLDMQHVYPVMEAEAESRECVNNLFFKELCLLGKALPRDFYSFLILLDTLLEKYFWCIPAMCTTKDISFYNYVKSATAITVTLLLSENVEKPYVIVAGHFSGIQRYIFSAANVGASGVAKRLRARSFYVNAMVSAVAHKIVHEMKIPMLNILMLTGGKFFVLLPNTDKVDTILEHLEKETLLFLYEKYKGNLSLELTWDCFDDNEIYDYGHTRSRLMIQIDKKKNRAFENILIENEQWNKEQFIVYKELSNKRMCSACRSALVDEKTSDKEILCHNCEIDEKLGGKLPRVRYFSFSRGKGEYQLLDTYYLNLDVSKYSDENYLIMKLNDANIEKFCGTAIAAYYVVNHVPLNDKEEVKNFSDIANQSTGSKKLGVIKADVDTLGFLFTEGLKEHKDDKISISRINTMSRMLDIFFGGCIQELITKKYEDIYCVFSGGDDLFFIGPWNIMPKLAININKKFHEFTCNNPCMTLSVAICVVDSGGHIATLAEECEHKLKKVKNEVDSRLYPNKTGRDAIYFLNKVMSWDDFEKQIKLGNWFADGVNKKISTSILRRIIKYSQMYQLYMNTGDVNQLMFLPFFSQELDRNIKNSGEIYEHLQKIYKKASNYNVLDKDFYYMEFALRYALLLTREEKR